MSHQVHHLRRSRALSLRLDPIFADWVALAIAGLMLLATVSVVAATGALSAHHARELAVLRAE